MTYNEWYQSGTAIVHGVEFQIPPNHSVPTTLLRAYIDDCVDMRCNYWEPNKP